MGADPLADLDLREVAEVLLGGEHAQTAARPAGIVDAQSPFEVGMKAVRAQPHVVQDVHVAVLVFVRAWDRPLELFWQCENLLICRQGDP
jgi:hypothetical protein